ncbi:hypothetical protein N7536_012267 [Penicillium majusculum]|nr:hypothetical protein N7536_012267 [Penicillium majusculum]
MRILIVLLNLSFIVSAQLSVGSSSYAKKCFKFHSKEGPIGSAQKATFQCGSYPTEADFTPVASAQDADSCAIASLDGWEGATWSEISGTEVRCNLFKNSVGVDRTDANVMMISRPISASPRDLKDFICSPDNQAHGSPPQKFIPPNIAITYHCDTVLEDGNWFVEEDAHDPDSCALACKRRTDTTSVECSGSIWDDALSPPCRTVTQCSGTRSRDGPLYMSYEEADMSFGSTTPPVPGGGDSSNTPHVPGGGDSSNTPHVPGGGGSSNTPHVPGGGGSSNTPHVPGGGGSSNTPHVPGGGDSSNTPHVPGGDGSSNNPHVPDGDSSSNTPHVPGGGDSSNTPHVPGGGGSSNTPHVPGGGGSSNTPHVPGGGGSSNTPHVPGGGGSSNTPHVPGGGDSSNTPHVPGGGGSSNTPHVPGGGGSSNTPHVPGGGGSFNTPFVSGRGSTQIPI